MKKIHSLLASYGESHQNKTNKVLHWICVPLIMFSLIGLIMHIPFLFEFSIIKNWATFLLIFALVYYLRLSFSLFIGFLVLSFFLVYGNIHLIEFCKIQGISSVWSLVLIFTLAWIGQFIGHQIEGKKPSFLQDLQFLLIGPAWLLHFIYKKFGISY